MTTSHATEFAPAKINLCLHVTGKQDDGYHLLDSLVVFCGIGDRVEARPANSLSLTLRGPFAGEVPAGDDNLVIRAARHLGRAAAITLEKHLPPASGIGGGTADAAAVIRALSRLHETGLPSARMVLPLGADLPVCLAGNPARMRGIGECLEALPALPGAHLLLVNPRITLSTPAVFLALKNAENPPLPETLPQWPDISALADWLSLQRNDLEPAACDIAPEIGSVLTLMKARPDCLLARMSGSGATCFGLFPTAKGAKAAARAIRRENPGWWVAEGPMLR
ncbi:MAG: 4-(cytidine 5'-diphospho)-2-C-methyl-D-erythritol kinase [Pseudorhodobacter sp.]